MEVKFYSIAGTNLKISAPDDMIDRSFEPFEIPELTGEKDLIEWIVEEDKAPACIDLGEELECPVPGYRMFRVRDEIWVYLEEVEDNRVEMIRLQDNFQRAIFYIPHFGFEHDWEYYVFARDSFSAVSEDVFSLVMLKRGGILIKGSSVVNHGLGTLISSEDFEIEGELVDHMKGRYGIDVLNHQLSICRVVLGRIRIFCCPWSIDVQERLNRNVPLQSVIFAGKAGDDGISPMSRDDATKLLTSRTVFPAWYKDSEREIFIVSKRILMSVVGCFKLEVHSAEKSAQLAKTKMEACSLV